ncbi:MAG: hypothetical protein FWF35_05090, partial [Elusimicrobia bacterium]|nr:hypothetical protein [Elusimicrobiota bacterium]
QRPVITKELAFPTQEEANKIIENQQKEEESQRIAQEKWTGKIAAFTLIPLGKLLNTLTNSNPKIKQNTNVDKIIVTFTDKNSKAARNTIKELTEDLMDVKSELSVLVVAIDNNKGLAQERKGDFERKKESDRKVKDFLEDAKKDLDSGKISEQDYKNALEKSDISSQEVLAAQDKVNDALERVVYYGIYLNYFKKREEFLETKLAYLKGEHNNLQDVIELAAELTYSAAALEKYTLKTQVSHEAAAKETAGQDNNNLKVYDLLKKRAEDRKEVADFWSLWHKIAGASKTNISAEKEFLSSIFNKEDEMSIRGKAEAMNAAGRNDLNVLLQQSIAMVKPYADGRYAVVYDDRMAGYKIRGAYHNFTDFLMKSFFNRPNAYYRNLLRVNIWNVVNNLHITQRAKNLIINNAPEFILQEGYKPEVAMDEVSGLEFPTAYDSKSDGSLQSLTDEAKNNSYARAVEQYKLDKRQSFKKGIVGTIIDKITGRQARADNLAFTKILNEKIFDYVNRLDIGRAEKQSILKSIMDGTRGFIFKAPYVKVDGDVKKLSGGYHNRGTYEQMEKKKLTIQDSSGKESELTSVTFMTDPRLKVKSENLFWVWVKDKYILHKKIGGRLDALVGWYMEIKAQDLAKLALEALGIQKEFFIVKLVDIRSYNRINTIKNRTGDISTDDSSESDISVPDEKRYPVFVRTTAGDIETKIKVAADSSFEMKTGDSIIINGREIILKTATGIEAVLNSAQFRLPKNKLEDFISLIKEINGAVDKLNLIVYVRLNKDKLAGLNWASMTSLSSAVRNLIGVFKDTMHLDQASAQFFPVLAYLPNLFSSFLQKMAQDLGDDKVLKAGSWVTLSALIGMDALSGFNLINSNAGFLIFATMALASVGLGLGSAMQQQTSKNLLSRHSITDEHLSANNAQWQLFKQYGSMLVALPYSFLKLILTGTHVVTKYSKDSMIFHGHNVTFFNVTYPILTAVVLWSLYKIYYAGYNKETDQNKKEKDSVPAYVFKAVASALKSNFNKLTNALRGDKENAQSAKISGRESANPAGADKLSNAQRKEELKRLGLYGKLIKSVATTAFTVAGEQAMDAIFLLLATGFITTQWGGDSGYGPLASFIFTMVPAIVARKVANNFIKKKSISDDEILALSGPLGAAGILGFLMTYPIYPLYGSAFVFIATLGLSNYQGQAMGVIEKTIYNLVNKEINRVKSGDEIESNMTEFYKDKNTDAKKLFSSYIAALFNKQMFFAGILTFMSAIVGVILFNRGLASSGYGTREVLETVAKVSHEAAQAKYNLDFTSQYWAGFVALALVAIPIFWQLPYLVQTFKNIREIRGYKGPLSQEFGVSRNEINAVRRTNLPAKDGEKWLGEDQKPQPETEPVLAY